MLHALSDKVNNLNTLNNISFTRANLSVIIVVRQLTCRYWGNQY
jgi:hypothetical protein